MEAIDWDAMKNCWFCYRNGSSAKIVRSINESQFIVIQSIWNLISIERYKLIDGDWSLYMQSLVVVVAFCRAQMPGGLYRVRVTHWTLWNGRCVHCMHTCLCILWKVSELLTKKNCVENPKIFTFKLRNTFFFLKRIQFIRMKQAKRVKVEIKRRLGFESTRFKLWKQSWEKLIPKVVDIFYWRRYSVIHSVCRHSKLDVVGHPLFSVA